jgi:large subunit ribosomal protein L16
MKISPQNLKFKKYHKPTKNFGISKSLFKLRFGVMGLQSLVVSSLNFKQLESGRKAIRRVLKKAGFLWIRPYPSSPITKKALSVRMGKGKGSVNSWISPISRGQVIYELKNLPYGLAKQAVRAALKKLPLSGRMLHLAY